MLGSVILLGLPPGDAPRDGSRPGDRPSSPSSLVNAASATRPSTPPRTTLTPTLTATATTITGTATPRPRRPGSIGCFGRLGLYQAVSPLLVGLADGLAGSLAVTPLVLAIIRDPRWARVYLLVFGLGTVAGLMLITAAVRVPFVYTLKRLARVNRYLATASGVLSLAFGLFFAYPIGVVDGLFSHEPHGTPA